MSRWEQFAKWVKANTGTDTLVQFEQLGTGSALEVLGQGQIIGAPTGGNKGSGTLNVAGSVRVNDSACLVSGNNLSDIGTASTARSNLGLGSSAVESLATVQAIAQNSQSAAYTTVLADAGKHLYHPASDANPRTFTIDSNANVAYPIGTAISFVNKINTLTIAITSDTLTLSPSGSTGSRTLAANGMATALKIGTTDWIISGSGLS